MIRPLIVGGVAALDFFYFGRGHNYNTVDILMTFVVFHFFWYLCAVRLLIKKKVKRPLKHIFNSNMHSAHLELFLEFGSPRHCVVDSKYALQIGRVYLSVCYDEQGFRIEGAYNAFGQWRSTIFQLAG